MFMKQKHLSRKFKQEQKLLKKDDIFYKKYGIHLSELTKNDEKFKIKYIFKFFHYFKNSIFKIIICFLAELLSAVAFIISSFTFTDTIDFTVSSGFTQAIWFMIITSGLQILGLLFDVVYVKVSTNVIAELSHQIRLDLISQTKAIKQSKLNEVESGAILSRINTDPGEYIREFANIMDKFCMGVRSMGRLFMLFYFSWMLGSIACFFGILTYLVTSIFDRKVLSKASNRDKIINDKYNSQSTELVKGMADIKNLNIFAHFFNKFRQISQYKKASQNDTVVKDGMSNWILNVSICYVGELVLILVGISLCTQNIIGLGIIATLFVYAFDALNSFVNFAHIKSSLFRMEITSRRMYEIFDPKEYPKESFGSLTLNNPKGKIDFCNVDFEYKEEKVFKDLSFSINSGECIGIVGRSGEGKSTILNLIPRIYDVTGGQIKIDDIDIRDLSCDCLRETVSVVPQSPYIFNLTIKENLLLVNPNATNNEIENACKRAVILDFIKSKPDGFETKIGEGGIKLSGGQKQRLAIARAFLKKSKILLLDEATSALDNESQDKIKSTIKNMKNSCTIIIVAHRLSTVADCDKILVLDDHKIAGFDTHKNLLKTCKAYQDLYKQEDELN